LLPESSVAFDGVAEAEAEAAGVVDEGAAVDEAFLEEDESAGIE
jgi:hypothetical protein